jgi:hypothetical protein
LLKRLSRLVREAPLVPGLSVRGTTWVNPGVFCDVVRTKGDKLYFKDLRD